METNTNQSKVLPRPKTARFAEPPIQSSKTLGHTEPRKRGQSAMFRVVDRSKKNMGSAIPSAYTVSQYLPNKKVENQAVMSSEINVKALFEVAENFFEKHEDDTYANHLPQSHGDDEANDRNIDELRFAIAGMFGKEDRAEMDRRFVRQKIHEDFMNALCKRLDAQSRLSDPYRVDETCAPSGRHSVLSRPKSSRISYHRSALTSARSSKNNTTHAAHGNSTLVSPQLYRKSRPNTAPATSITSSRLVNRIQRPLTPAEAEIVTAYLDSTYPFSEKRKSRPKTLEEWVLENSAKEPIWNANAFSTQKYISVYCKTQSIEEAKRERLLGSHAKVPDRIGTGPHSTSTSPTPPMKTESNTVEPNKSGVRTSTANQTILNPRIPRSVFFQTHPETYLPLLKPAVARTSEENKIIFKAMRGIHAFKALSDFTLNQVCACLKYQEFSCDRAIFKQGDFGTAWYILLSGTVSVRVTKTGLVQDSFQVATLKEGDGFGDLALFNDQPRAATILTLTPCETVSVDKVDYNRIIKFTHETERKEKILFLRKHPIFSEWPMSHLNNLSQLIHWKRYPAGSVIVEEGQPISQLMIIRSGGCIIYRNLRKHASENEPGGSKFKEAKVRVGILCPLDYFGEESCLWEEESEDKEKQHVEYARATIVAARKVDLEDDSIDFLSSAVATCDTKTRHTFSSKSTKNEGKQHQKQVKQEDFVEVAVISCFDARTHFQSSLIMNPLYDMKQDDIERLHKKYTNKKIWERQRRRFVTRILKERHRDPTMIIT